jgi:hypothetical protein
MNAGALIFMLGMWTLIIVLNIYCFMKILRNQGKKE